MQRVAVINEQTTMNEVLHLLMERLLRGGGSGGLHDCHATGPRSTSDSHV